MSSTSRRDKILLNPYRDWAKAQGIPIYEGFGLISWLWKRAAGISRKPTAPWYI